jgi:hypothetical protein
MMIHLTQRMRQGSRNLAHCLIMIDKTLTSHPWHRVFQFDNFLKAHRYYPHS